MRNYFLNACNEFGINISENEISKFFQFKDLLISWNTKFNLTAITDEKEILIKHFLDSLTIVKYLEKGAAVVDVGTGAGFPAIPISIMRNDIYITMLDSLNKRIDFLNFATDKLLLSNVKIVNSRAEIAGQNINFRESFDFSVSRAVAPLAELTEYCLPFVKVGGFFIAMKGGNAQKEIDEAEFAISVLGGVLVDVDNFNLEKGESLRSIITIKKIKSTDNKYPRRPGLPGKRPLMPR